MLSHSTAKCIAGFTKIKFVAGFASDPVDHVKSEAVTFLFIFEFSASFAVFPGADSLVFTAVKTQGAQLFARFVNEYKRC